MNYCMYDPKDSKRIETMIRADRGRCQAGQRLSTACLQRESRHVARAIRPWWGRERAWEREAHVRVEACLFSEGPPRHMHKHSHAQPRAPPRNLSSA